MRFKFSVIMLVILLGGTMVAQEQPASAKEGHTSGWNEFNSAEGQFTVCVPGIPKADVATVGTIFGPLKTYFFVVQSDTFLYYISYADLSVSPQTPAEIKMALDQTRDRTVAKGRILSENVVTFDGIAGREVLLERNGLIQKGRFFYGSVLRPRRSDRTFHLLISPDIPCANDKPLRYHSTPSMIRDISQSILAFFPNC